MALAEHGIHLFIEKPLSDTIDGVDELLSLCHEQGVVLMVGYNFRFYEPFQAIHRALAEEAIGRVLSARAEVGQYLPEWRPGTDYRENVSARRQLGGGVLLELSHEIDYLRWFIGEVTAVTAQVAHVSDLDVDVEDTAEIILQFRNGAIGSVHLDMVQRPATRTCHIVGTKGTIKWDRQTHRVQLCSPTTETWQDLYPEKAVDTNEMYIAEMCHFLDCVRGAEVPLTNGVEGRRVLEMVLAARRSSEEQRTIQL